MHQKLELFLEIGVEADGRLWIKFGLVLVSGRERNRGKGENCFGCEERQMHV